MGAMGAQAELGCQPTSKGAYQCFSVHIPKSFTHVRQEHWVIQLVGKMVLGQ